MWLKLSKAPNYLPLPRFTKVERTRVARREYQKEVKDYLADKEVSLDDIHHHHTIQGLIVHDV